MNIEINKLRIEMNDYLILVNGNIPIEDLEDLRNHIKDTKWLVYEDLKKYQYGNSNNDKYKPYDFQVDSVFTENGKLIVLNQIDAL